jgi:hypothetical protein
LVQFYGSDEESLAANVTKYLAEGLKKGEGAIVIATPEHVDLFKRRLGVPDQSYRVLWLDAEETLARFMVGGMPDWDRFQEIAVPAIQGILKETEGLRAYGEMVGVLWTAGKRHAAILLEQLWNRLLSRSAPSFNLFCGYPIDVLSKDFDPASVDALLCTHTHILPAEGRRLETSLCQAMEEVLGSKAEGAESAMKDERFRARWGILPRSEGLILWLRRNLPLQADEILSRARSYSRVDAAA